MCQNYVPPLQFNKRQMLTCKHVFVTNCFFIWKEWSACKRSQRIFCSLVGSTISERFHFQTEDISTVVSNQHSPKWNYSRQKQGKVSPSASPWTDPPPQVWGSCRLERWVWESKVTVASLGCEAKVACPRRCTRWVAAWASLHLNAGSSHRRPTSRLPGAFLCPNLMKEGHGFRDMLFFTTTAITGAWISNSSTRATPTMRTEQRLGSEQRCLQHVRCLDNQHVLQPAQVLKLQPFVRLRQNDAR